MVRYLIKEYRPYLTRQEVKTINGQSKAGNEEAALKGLYNSMGFKQEFDYRGLPIKE